MRMERTEFRSEVLPSEGRWPAWNQNLSRFAVDTDGFGSDRPFDGAMRTCAAPSGLSFTVVESCAPQRLSASPGMVANVFWLALILAGNSVLDLGEEPIPMSPGDILYGKRGAPSSLEIRTQFRMLLVNIPGELLSRKVLLPLPNKAIWLPGRSGMGRILSSLLGAVADSLDELNEMLTGPIEAALAQLLLSTLFGEQAERPLGGAATIRAGLLQRLWQAIELSLDDPGLSLGRIAAAEGLSVRYVQKLFEESGQSFSSYVRRRRLEQCRSDLANPLNANVSITSTCFHWGFNDAATFSRAFRDEFGVSPREYRRTHARPNELARRSQRPRDPSRAPSRN
jgi:AraC-like DNA-binding protein